MSDLVVDHETPTPAITAEVAEALVVDGDLSKLTPAQRTEYYLRVCRSLGLNPLTRPFQYIKLQGKLTLYATRDATDQIRNLRNISVRQVRCEFVLDNSLYVVEVEAELPNGRKDFATAAVPVKGLVGDALANALMKAETKAKRRVTLSIAGLGMLDETEVETIPDTHPANGEEAYPSYEGTNGEDDAAALTSNKQLKKIHALARRAGMSRDEYRKTLEQAYGVDSARKLTVEQASEFIDYLQSLLEDTTAQAQASTPTTNPPSTDCPDEIIKQQCVRLGFSKPESIAIRSAIRASGVDLTVAAQVLSEVGSKTDAINGLRMVGVPNPFKMSAAAGT